MKERAWIVLEGDKIKKIEEEEKGDFNSSFLALLQLQGSFLYVHGELSNDMRLSGETLLCFALFHNSLIRNWDRSLVCKAKSLCQA